MLPGIRALLGAIVAAIGMLVISFGLVATFRVAQDARIGLVQADLAQRGRSLIAPSEESRATLLIDRPAPLEANPVSAVEIKETPAILEEVPETPISVVLAAPQSEPPATELPATEVPTTEPPWVPMGGPLPEQTVIYTNGVDF